MAKQGGRRKVQLPDNRRNYVSFVVTEPPDITTMHSHVKDVKDSSGGVLLKMLYTFANLATHVKWICICEENVRNVD